MAVDAPYAPAALPLADAATRGRIQKTATDFEASFLQVMLGQMFSTVDTGAFGGGVGEDAFKSFLTDSMAKSMAAHGGIGLSKDIAREMLKLQGLS
jgi:flagellar protein FlgJ